MNATQHPEYLDESAKLDDTLDFIRAELEYYKDPLAYGADTRTATRLAQGKATQREKLQAIQGDPYFGRVDWITDNATTPEIFYIGLHELSDKGIFSWKETLPGELYYTKNTKKESGKLLLKRSFEINASQITTIVDEYSDQERKRFFAALLNTQSVDSYLNTLLDGTRDGQLHDIVATIQVHQYELITQQKEGVLIIQGAPGSGKSQIALHRISYLLYPKPNTKKILKNRVLFLGPNPIFLRYIQHVLSELGDRQIPQLVFDELARQQLKEDLNFESQEETLDLLLNSETPSAVKAMLYINAYNKASLHMATLLERYVRYLWTDIIGELETVSIQINVMTNEGRRLVENISISPDQIRQAALTLEHVPLNQRKDMLIETLSQGTAYEFRTLHKLAANLGKAIDNQIAEKLRLYFYGWKAQNCLVAYRRLLRTSEFLHQLGNDIFSQWELELMHFDAPKQTTPFRFSDLGGLLYLQLLLDGKGERSYDHIVVDEAQDMTPLYFKVLSAYCPSHSFTITGDLSQGIYPYHNMEKWEDLGKIFDSNNQEPIIIRQSYRSTKQIMDFANRLLRRIGEPDERLAEPLSRDGMDVQDWSTSSTTARAKLIAELAEECLEREYKSIAIIGKTLQNCRSLATELSEADMSNFQMIESRDNEYKGGVAIIPSYLTKGIEFDVVIVADADSRTYVPTVMDARLLYVSLTRASHELHICWVGERTPLLDESIDSLPLQDYFKEQLAPQSMTIEEYARSRDLKPDWCVARLAALGKLYLLGTGEIDAVCADNYLTPWERGEISGEEEEEIKPLDSVQSVGIIAQIAQLEEDRSPSNERTLAAIQLVYALLRNILGSAGILESQSDESIANQTLALATLWQAVQRDHYRPSSGAWTSRKQALERVSKLHRPLAGDLFELMTNFGLIERKQLRMVRVVVEWIPDLLQLAMGSISSRFDRELVESLGTEFTPIHEATHTKSEALNVA